jgi:hypothetical protein
MNMKSIVALFALAAAALQPGQGQAPSLLLTPDAPEMNRRAPERFNVWVERRHPDRSSSRLGAERR